MTFDVDAAQQLCDYGTLAPGETLTARTVRVAVLLPDALAEIRRLRAMHATVEGVTAKAVAKWQEAEAEIERLRGQRAERPTIKPEEAVMCGCEAHRKLVDCTCGCDHTDDRLTQYRARIRELEAQVQRVEALHAEAADIGDSITPDDRGQIGHWLRSKVGES